MTRSSKIKWGAFILVDLALAAWLFMLFSARGQINELDELRDLGTSIYPQLYAIRPFSLTSTRGEEFTHTDFNDQWSLVFFGFSNCPDICPMSMAELGQFYRQLEAENDLPLPQVVMATVDPQRDDLAAMQSYVTEFNENFLGLTGEESQLSLLAEQLYVVANTTADQISEHSGHVEGGSTEDSTEDGAGNEDDAMAMDMAGNGASNNAELLFDHSGHISVINPDGELYAVMRLPHRDQDLLTAYRLLVGIWNR